MQPKGNHNNYCAPGKYYTVLKDFNKDIIKSGNNPTIESQANMISRLNSSIS